MTLCMQIWISACALKESADSMDSLSRAFEGAGVLRSRDLEARGVSREIVRRAVRDGRLERVGRGLYALPDSAPSEHHSLVLAVTRVSGARISHLSALAFHQLTTQNPREVWITISRTARSPEVDVVPLRVIRCPKPQLDLGLEWHEVEGVRVPVYSVARTLVDLFRQRNKLGVDLAVEALRDAWGERRFTLRELNPLAAEFRMSKVMKPYLESLLS